MSLSDLYEAELISPLFLLVSFQMPPQGKQSLATAAVARPPLHKPGPSTTEATSESCPLPSLVSKFVDRIAGNFSWRQVRGGGGSVPILLDQLRVRVLAWVSVVDAEI